MRPTGIFLPQIDESPVSTDPDGFNRGCLADTLAIDDGDSAGLVALLTMPE